MSAARVWKTDTIEETLNLGLAAADVAPLLTPHPDRDRADILDLIQVVAEAVSVDGLEASFVAVINNKPAMARSLLAVAQTYRSRLPVNQYPSALAVELRKDLQELDALAAKATHERNLFVPIKGDIAMAHMTDAAYESRAQMAMVALDLAEDGSERWPEWKLNALHWLGSKAITSRLCFRGATEGLVARMTSTREERLVSQAPTHKFSMEELEALS